MNRGRAIAIAIAVVAIAAVGAVSVRSALDSPERQVSAFLDATAAGNESAALEAWHVFTGGIHPRPALLERRARLTDDLASGGVGRSYRVSSIEWWRTCCEPGPITDPRNAGLARIHVAAIDRTGAEHRLVFEVFVRSLTWWGDAGGDTERNWTLYEVHRETQPCVFPSTAFGCTR